jgi:AraC-like DNA-binding protein
MLFQSITKDTQGASSFCPTNADGPLAELHFVLSGKSDVHIPGLDKISLSAGEYTLIHRPSASYPWPDSAGRKTISFTISFPVHRLQDFAISFPELRLFLQKVQTGMACQLTERAGIADHKMIRAIRNIMACAYNDEQLKNRYWDLQLSDLVMIALVRLSGNDADCNGLPALKPLDIEKVEATRRYLLQNMDHPPTLIKLARKMGLNDFKLKKAYKQLYGTTLFEDFLHARMKKAKSLLEQTDQSIVGIAELAGYKNVSGFSVAFKKYYGVPPGELRKRS